MKSSKPREHPFYRVLSGFKNKQAISKDGYCKTNFCRWCITFLLIGVFFIGSSFSVFSQTPPSAEEAPREAIAMADDGSFVVASTGNYFGSSVFADGYYADGCNKFRVYPTVRTGVQMQPAVAMTDDGSFVVAWEDDNDGNGSYQIYAAGFNANGIKQFGDITVNTVNSGQQLKPAIAMTDDGSFVVAWEDDNDGNGSYQIYAAGFNANGIKQFGDITVNTVNNGQQLRPVIAVADDGSFVVAWEDDNDENNSYQIYAAGFNANGIKQFGDITVNTVNSGQQLRPVIAMADDGSFNVAWEDDNDGNGSYQIYAAGFNANGIKQFGDITVNNVNSGQQLKPAIAMADDGSFNVAWEDDNDENDSYQIYAAGFNANGIKQFGDITVNTVSSGQQVRPAIAMANDGIFAVSWRDDNDLNNTYSLYIAGFNANGTKRFGDVPGYDLEEPVVTCVGDTARDTDPEVCTYTIVGTELDATFTANCDRGNITNNINGTATLADEVFTKGATTVTWTVEDGSGQTATCTSTITVEDNEAPVISCPDDRVDVIATSANGGIVTYDSPEFSDNCEGSTLQLVTTGFESGATFPIGDTIVTYEVTDDSDNKAKCSFMVNVTGVAPEIVCPEDIVVNNDAGQCGASVEFEATETTGIPASTIIYSIEPGSFFDVGETEVTAAGTNSLGTSECTFTITVNDITQPTITCPADITVDTDSGLCEAANVDLGTPVVTDNCSGTGNALNFGDFNDQVMVANSAYLQLSKGTMEAWIKTSDAPSYRTIITKRPAYGLYLYNGALVTYDFVTNSRISTGVFLADGDWHHVAMTFDNGVLNGSHIYVDGIDVLTFTYNTGAQSNSLGIGCWPNNFDQHFRGDIDEVRIWNVERSSAEILANMHQSLHGITGLVASYSFDQGIAEGDNSSPAVDQLTDGTGSNNGTLTNFTLNGPKSNWVEGIISGLETINNAPGNYAVGETVVTWTATDAAGNWASCEQIITVEDNEDPTIACVADVTQDTDEGLCTAAVYDIAPTVDDNCTVETVTYEITGATIDSGDDDASDTDFNFGTSTVTYTVTDEAGNESTCSFNVNINNVITTTSVTVTPVSQQYSDMVTFEAMLTPGECIGAGQAATEVDFFVGTQMMGTAPLTLDNGSLIGTLTVPLLEDTFNGQMAPGIHEVTASFTGIDPDFTVEDAITSLTITQEDAIVEYTGQSLQATPSSSSSLATVALSANIQDITVTDFTNDPNAGDIRNAKVMFVNRDNGSQISGWLPVNNLVDPSDNRTGTVTYEWIVDIGNQDSQSFTVGIIVDTGYYLSNSSEDDTVITVYVPIGDFITGGGYIIPYESSGQYASTDGLKTNFGFNVKYNKKGKKLKGHMNIIFRRLESDGMIHVYQIKSNAVQSLGVDTSDETAQFATFITKSNLTDITDPLYPTSLGGNLTLKADMTDRGEPGVYDSIAFTLTNANGTLLYSSNWTGISTGELVLSGGNLVVHSGFSVNARSSGSDSDPVVETDLGDIFEVKTWPVPSDNYFNIKVTSGNDSDKVKIQVFDIRNQLVHYNEFKSDEQYQFGQNLHSGLYFVRLGQGNNTKVLRVIKY